MSEQEAESLIGKYDYRAAKAMMRDTSTYLLGLIFLYEVIQAFFLIWVLGTFSFLPEYLDTDWTFVVYKIFWIKVIIELILHLMTWVLLYYQRRQVHLNGWNFTYFRSAWVWIILIGEIASCLYTIFTLIWASIVTSQKWDKSAPFSDNLYRTFSIVMLVFLFVDAIIVFLEFWTLLYYFRKMVIHAKVVRRLSARAGFMTATKFLAEEVSMVTGIKYLKSKCSDQQIKAMANMTTGCNKWSRHHHDEFDEEDELGTMMKDVDV